MQRSNNTNKTYIRQDIELGTLTKCHEQNYYLFSLIFNI